MATSWTDATYSWSTLIPKHSPVFFEGPLIRTTSSFIRSVEKFPFPNSSHWFVNEQLGDVKFEERNTQLMNFGWLGRPFVFVVIAMLWILSEDLNFRRIWVDKEYDLNLNPYYNYNNVVIDICPNSCRDKIFWGYHTYMYIVEMKPWVAETDRQTQDFCFEYYKLTVSLWICCEKYVS